MTNLQSIHFISAVIVAWTAVSVPTQSAEIASDARSLPPAPRIAMLWSPARGDSSPEGMLKHDLVLMGVNSLGLKFNQQPTGLADGFTPQSIEVARAKVQRWRELNPRVVILAEVLFYEWPDTWLPEDHPWWMRKDGKRLQFWPGTHRMNWYDPKYRDHVATLTAALKPTGIDGAFYDNLREEPEPWVTLLRDVRRRVGDDFLILANTGYAVGRHDFAAPFLNGFMYESGWSHNRTQWSDTIAKMQHSETLLRKPRISVIERFEEIRDNAGWPGDAKRGGKPPADPAARHWSLCYALTIGDFYYLFSDNTSHRHDWYPEYDHKIGQPLAPPEQVNSHFWKRRYEKALVAVNLPGAPKPVKVKLEGEARDILTGDTGMEFEIAPGEGRILATP